MNPHDPIYTPRQLLGAVLLSLMVAAVAVVLHCVPQPSVLEAARLADSLRVADSLHREQRRDSLRQVWAERDSLRRDSLRQVWEVRNRLRRDSLRQVWAVRDSLRRDSLHALWATRDSLRRDSLARLGHYHSKKDTLIELNSADTTDLMCLRGIGNVRAARIVQLRNQLGGFYSAEQVRGIVPDSVLNHLTADPKHIRRIAVNRCSLQQLTRHPYIRFEQAKALYELRRQQSRLSGIEDLRKLDGWTENDLNRLIFYLSFE